MDGELYFICDNDAVEFAGTSSPFVPQIPGTVCSQHLLLCHQNVGLSHSIFSFYPSLSWKALKVFTLLVHQPLFLIRQNLGKVTQTLLWFYFSTK